MIFIVLGILLIVFFTAMFVQSLARNEARLTAGFVDHQIAFQLAESGIEQGLFALKANLATNQLLHDAMVSEVPTEIQFTPAATEELGLLIDEPAEGEVRLRGFYEPQDPEESASVGDFRIGRLTLHSLGIYTNPQGRRARRQIRVTAKVTGLNLGIVAPDHGLFVRDPLKTFFKVPSFALDVRDIKVMGGDVYIENGINAELTEHVINEEFRPMHQLGFFDLGVDVWNLASLFNGGLNLTHSRRVEYKQGGITREYYKFMGLGELFVPDSPLYRRVIENYVPQVRSRPQGYTNKEINLYRPRDYKEIATNVINPLTQYNRDGDPKDNRYFRDIFFQGPLNFRNTVYQNVLPLYGYGDWRRVPARLFDNPTRRDDISQAIHLDGVTFVRGDVFLEGWYEGIGTLAVQGNVYLGGDFMGLPPQTTGYPSLVNLVILEDPDREPYGGGRNTFDKVTGKLIVRPHHDADFDRMHMHMLRDMDPVIDGAVYAQNGTITDRSSFLDQFFNMEVEFNYASERFDLQTLPHDLTIYGTDPEDILRGVGGRRGNIVFYNPQITAELTSWEEETPAL